MSSVKAVSQRLGARIAIRLSAPLLAIGLGACDAGSSETRLNLSIADAPVDDAVEVVLRLRGVELELADGETRVLAFEPPLSIDLLQASGGKSLPLLRGASVPDGTYAALRLLPDRGDGERASYVRLRSGAEHPLLLSEAGERSLRLQTPFEIPPRLTSSYTVHLDLRRSVFAPEPGAAGYQLRPVLRLINDAEAGAISGRIGSRLLRSGCRPAVYAFTGQDSQPDDVDGDGVEPFASAALTMHDGAFAYTLAFLPPGDYRVAFTCDAAEDDPARDDRLRFVPAAGALVTVRAARAATLDLGDDASPGECRRGGKPDKPGRGDKPNKPEKPNKPDKPDKPDKPEKPERPEKPDEPEDPERPGGDDDPPADDTERERDPGSAPAPEDRENDPPDSSDTGC